MLVEIKKIGFNNIGHVIKSKVCGKCCFLVAKFTVQWNIFLAGLSVTGDCNIEEWVCLPPQFWTVILLDIWPYECPCRGYSPVTVGSFEIKPNSSCVRACRNAWSLVWAGIICKVQPVTCLAQRRETLSLTQTCCARSACQPVLEPYATTPPSLPRPRALHWHG